MLKVRSNFNFLIFRYRDHGVRKYEISMRMARKKKEKTIASDYINALLRTASNCLHYFESFFMLFCCWAPCDIKNEFFHSFFATHNRVFVYDMTQCHRQVATLRTAFFTLWVIEVNVDKHAERIQWIIWTFYHCWRFLRVIFRKGHNQDRRYTSTEIDSKFISFRSWELLKVEIFLHRIFNIFGPVRHVKIAVQWFSVYNIKIWLLNFVEYDIFKKIKLYWPIPMS